MPLPLLEKSILILSSNLHLRLSNSLLPSRFLTKAQYAPLLFPIRATYPTHFIVLYSTIRHLQPFMSLSGLILEVPRSHTRRHHSRWDSSGRVISLSQKPLPDNTQHSQRTTIHAPGGIRTRNPSKRSAVDTLLRPLGHWDRLFFI